MRYTLLSVIVSITLLMIGCKSTSELTRKSVFTFSINESEYQIISLNTSSGEGTNYLARVEESPQPIMLARDLDQDGIIDLILKEDKITLPLANQIYKEGITQAKDLGNYKEQFAFRTFEYIDGSILYTIKSYVVNNESSSILFLIFDSESGKESILIDNNADGTLESIEKGSITLENAKPLYTRILKEGLDQDKIEYKKGVYIVKVIQPLESATAFNQ